MHRVELAGLPGSGKSTVLPIVKRVLNSHGINCLGQTELIRRYHKGHPAGRMAELLVPSDRIKNSLAIKWYRKNKREQLSRLAIDTFPKLYHQVESFAQSESQMHAPANDIRSWFLSTLSSQYLADNQLASDETLILDEGFFQKLINFFVGSNGCQYLISDLQAYLSLVPPTRCLVKVDVSSEESVARVRARATPLRFDHLPDRDFAILLDKVDDMFERGIEILDKSGVAIVRLSNNDSPDDIESKVDQAVSEQLHMLV